MPPAEAYFMRPRAPVCVFIAGTGTGCNKHKTTTHQPLHFCIALLSVSKHKPSPRVLWDDHRGRNCAKGIAHTAHFHSGGLSTTRANSRRKCPLSLSPYLSLSLTLSKESGIRRKTFSILRLSTNSHTYSNICSRRKRSLAAAISEMWASEFSTCLSVSLAEEESCCWVCWYASSALDRTTDTLFRKRKKKNNVCRLWWWHILNKKGGDGTLALHLLHHAACPHKHWRYHYGNKRVPSAAKEQTHAHARTQARISDKWGEG